MFVCGGLFFRIVLILVITFEETEQPQIDVEKYRDDYVATMDTMRRSFARSPGSRESTKVAAYNSKIMTTAVRARMRFNF